MSGEKILDYWTPGSQMLADAGHFLSELENFDKNGITEEMISKLKPYIENPNFHPAKVSDQIVFTFMFFLLSQYILQWKIQSAEPSIIQIITQTIVHIIITISHTMYTAPF